MANYTKVVEDIKKGYKAETLAYIREGLAAGQLSIRRDFDLPALFAECFGYHQFAAFRNTDMTYRQLSEAAGAVSTASFQDITFLYVNQGILDAYNIPDAVFSGLIPTRPTKQRSERIPGITHIGDEAGVVNEGQEYPVAGVSEDWIDTPDVVKRGLKVQITKEAVTFDLTAQIVERCKYVGEWLRLNKEKRAIDCVADLGETTTAKYRYRWQGQTIATYGDNSGTHNWDNLSASTPLTDFTALNTAWLLLSAIEDPATGEPQSISAKHLVVTPGNAINAEFALRGDVKRTAPGYATSANPVQTGIPNPIATVLGNVQVVGAMSQLLKKRQGNDTTWYLGDLTKAFAYNEVWPVQVIELGAGTQPDMDRDIIQQFRASEMGTYVTLNPRYMIKATA